MLFFFGCLKNIYFNLAFALCSAVFMSLQYPISAEINGPLKIKMTYTLNVMVSGFGVMVGPTISGGLLDRFNRDYTIIFELSLTCFILSMIFFSTTKFLIIYAKYIKNRIRMNDSRI